MSVQKTCRVTQDKSLQNKSAAIVFHLPDLHWEGYNYPEYRDPDQPWILMTYESGNSIRQRAHYQVEDATCTNHDHYH